MKIAMLAPLFESVPPKTYGGTELVIAFLTQELVSMGHEVSLFASADSEVPAKIVPVVREAVRPKESGLIGKFYEGVDVYDMVNLYEVLRRAGEFDLIHNHTKWPALLFGKLVSTPVLTTVHWRAEDIADRFLFEYISANHLAAISHSQAKHLKESHFSRVRVVHHGLDLETYAFAGDLGGYLFFIGLISPFKGVETAISVSLKTGKKLIIAGSVPAIYENYFQESVAPHLDDKQISFVGELEMEKKIAYFQKAEATLFPIVWEEPFGLVMIESMACGTPVIAFNRGSVPEVIQDGQSGFVVEDEAEMVEAVERVGEIDRGACRALMEAKFSSVRMAKDYENLYREMIEGGWK